jgi:hypothetical protein
MAAFIYDGKSNLTVTASDTVVLTVDPTLFTQATQTGANVGLQFGANTLTVVGATISAGSLANITLAGGTFAVGTGATGTGSANSLVLGTDGSIANYTTGTTTADSKSALFGGAGISSPNDGNDSFTIGGKGSFLVYGNGGVDTVAQTATAFDNTSAVTVFGGKGADVITLNTAANKGSLLVYGGEDADKITVLNTGNTTIFGGTGAGDSTDGNDSIGLLSSGGTITVFANGGDDLINGDANSANFLTSGTGFVDGTKATIFGGAGNDSVNVSFASGKGTVTVYGGENNDTIKVANTGTTTIYGGTGQGDSTDGADNIILTGSAGSVTVFANAGDDFITGTAATNNVTAFGNGVVANLYGGRGNDTINVGYDAITSKGTINVFGGEDQDSITVANTAGSATTVYGGTGQGDATDGADLITITGQGTATVFGNGGADSINLNGFVGASGSASANVVTVYGGTGNDSISLGNTVNGTVTYNLNGNEGNDTFIVGVQGRAETQTVTFQTLANGDTFTFAGVTVNATGAVDAADLAAAFGGKAAGASIAVANATVTGNLTGFSTAASATNTVAFTSVVEDNIGAITGTGAKAPTAVNATAGSTQEGISSISTGNGVTIADFAVGSDKLSIQNGVVGSSTPTITVTPSAGFTDLQAALNAASATTTKGSVGVVAFGGNAYVVTNNDGVSGFTASADSAIKLTGVTDLNGVVNSITVL